MLRLSRINPTLSVYNQVEGNFDFNITLLVPPGTRVLIHEQNIFSTPNIPIISKDEDDITQNEEIIHQNHDCISNPITIDFPVITQEDNIFISQVTRTTGRICKQTKYLNDYSLNYIHNIPPRVTYTPPRVSS